MIPPSQEWSTSCWENIYPGESETFQPVGGDKNFSQEGRFCLTKKRGVWNFYFHRQEREMRSFASMDVFWPDQKKRGRKNNLLAAEDEKKKLPRKRARRTEKF